MTQVDLADYKNIYLATAREYIDIMSSCLAKLADNLQDTDALKALHIASHSLRSQSQVMGYTDIASVSAMIEKNSKDILDGVSRINNGFVNFLKKSVTELNLELDKIAKGDPSLRSG